MSEVQWVYCVSKWTVWRIHSTYCWPEKSDKAIEHQCHKGSFVGCVPTVNPFSATNVCNMTAAVAGGSHAHSQLLQQSGNFVNLTRWLSDGSDQAAVQHPDHFYTPWQQAVQERLHTKTLIVLHMLHITGHARVRAIILGPLFMVNSKLMTCVGFYKVTYGKFRVPKLASISHVHTILILDMLGIYLLSATLCFIFFKKIGNILWLCALKWALMGYSTDILHLINHCTNKVWHKKLELPLLFFLQGFFFQKTFNGFGVLSNLQA